MKVNNGSDFSESRANLMTSKRARGGVSKSPLCTGGACGCLIQTCETIRKKVVYSTHSMQEDPPNNVSASLIVP